VITITLKSNGKTSKFGFDPGTTRGMERKMKHMRPAMEHALDLMVEGELVLYSTEGASVGKKWKPYTAAEKRYYLPYKVRQLGVEKPMLRWSRSASESAASGERLYPSLTRRGEENIARAWDTGFEYGSTVPWAANHQYGRGSYHGKYTIPRRTVLAMSKVTQREIVRGMQAHIFGGKMTTPRGRAS